MTEDSPDLEQPGVTLRKDDFVSSLPPPAPVPSAEDTDEEDGSADDRTAMEILGSERPPPSALLSPLNTTMPEVSFSDSPTETVPRPTSHVSTAPPPTASEITGPMATVAVLPPPQADRVTCPECGTVAMVTLTRREAGDFCRNCDYPLFWTPAKILLDRGGLSDDSLRRLPGTVGRVTIASFPCPHCAELNAVTAIDCIRCGRPLRPVHFEPRRAPVMIEPEPEPEPEPLRIPAWVWAAIAALFVTIIIVGIVVSDVFD